MCLLILSKGKEFVYLVIILITFSILTERKINVSNHEYRCRNTCADRRFSAIVYRALL